VELPRQKLKIVFAFHIAFNVLFERATDQSHDYGLRPIGGVFAKDEMAKKSSRAFGTEG
jgi:hypothetical protein